MTGIGNKSQLHKDCHNALEDLKHAARTYGKNWPLGEGRPHFSLGKLGIAAMTYHKAVAELEAYEPEGQP